MFEQLSLCTLLPPTSSCLAGISRWEFRWLPCLWPCLRLVYIWLPPEKYIRLDTKTPGAKQIDLQNKNNTLHHIIFACLFPMPQFGELSCTLLSEVDGGHLSALISFLNLWANLPHNPTTNYSPFEVLREDYDDKNSFNLIWENKRSPTFWPESMSWAW